MKGMNDTRMNSIVRIVNSSFKTSTNGVLDVESELNSRLLSTSQDSSLDLCRNMAETLGLARCTCTLGARSARLCTLMPRIFSCAQ